ncbi:CsbD family protein [Methylomonas sp. LL1]|uniref:CsbD family protein n=1 Tax=Methylomonas sp. LL1 TaxID=2785785 RepID=UPI0018C38A16|nr:CsbD family protein [Methylomonas sp. LL1]QPK64545.1 CsbD family protein [Methylomonas sp. LL1]
MKFTQNKSTLLMAGFILSFCGLNAYAENSKIEAPMNDDQVEGRVEETKGKVKEVTGKILDDKGMEVEGNVQKNLGKAQKGYGDLKQDIKEGN